jgi:hypothetical protein
MVQTGTPQWVLDSVRTTVNEAIEYIASDTAMHEPPLFGMKKIKDPNFIAALVAKTVQCAMKAGHRFDVGALRSFNAVAFPDDAPDHALITAITVDDEAGSTNVEILYDATRAIQHRP